ncbi:hypothetical protein KEU06_09590 [Pseudaminobacter sp. 19-2017]|uniref:Uncharacterized protein n=1 Tax=Pseudaminobacter soli (ex Zhang et al. 2022) TaxID=2831468 RepID=A0A942I2K0_9HYPH|nr:hypothetical protein [Pseudaminobacter soli]MBS3648858.1 hypothetical protein [Pseudaminobacter soli]
MAHYRMVWSPEGVPFEVTPDKADDLVLNKGWFNSKPVYESVIVGDEKAPEPPRRGKKFTPEPS